MTTVQRPQPDDVDVDDDPDLDDDSDLDFCIPRLPVRAQLATSCKVARSRCRR